MDYQLHGFTGDHGPPKKLAVFHLTPQGKVQFDTSQSDATFVRDLEIHGHPYVTPCVRPDEGQAFIDACIAASSSFLWCNHDSDAFEEVSDPVPESDENGGSSTLRALYACGSMDEVESFLEARYCTDNAPDSSERVSNPPPSGNGKAA